MDVRRKRRLRVLIVLSLLIGGTFAGQWFLGYGGWSRPREWDWSAAFLVAPYVQLGNAPQATPRESLEVLWQTSDRDAEWAVAVQAKPDGPWTDAEAPECRRTLAEGLGPRRLYRAKLADLEPGEEFTYRLLRGGAPVFTARARARKPAGRPHRFVAFGDCGAGTPEQRAIAFQIARTQPDFALVAGDIAYYKGRLTDYRDKFFPIYNSDTESPDVGAPLLRSIPFLTAAGNHDLIERDLDANPDGLAYFLVWSLPLNGPNTAPGSANTPKLIGSAARRRAFLELAGSAYPRAANYSFDYGGAHWTVLDTNPYVDCTDSALRSWIARDLAAASKAAWRFVAFHQPPFHSTKAHTDEQRTRLLVDLFEEHHVDLVFCGHIHNYQRTYPLRFVAELTRDGRAMDSEGRVPGRWTLDTAFDGQARTTPEGVIYVITGGGGARLYDSSGRDTAYREPFTAKYVSDLHSFTVVDVEPTNLTVRQVSADGKELDRFTVTK